MKNFREYQINAPGNVKCEFMNRSNCFFDRMVIIKNRHKRIKLTNQLIKLTEAYLANL